MALTLGGGKGMKLRSAPLRSVAPRSAWLRCAPAHGANTQALGGGFGSPRLRRVAPTDGRSRRGGDAAAWDAAPLPLRSRLFRVAYAPRNTSGMRANRKPPPQAPAPPSRGRRGCGCGADAPHPRGRRRFPARPSLSAGAFPPGASPAPSGRPARAVRVGVRSFPAPALAVKRLPPRARLRSSAVRGDAPPSQPPAASAPAPVRRRLWAWRWSAAGRSAAAGASAPAA